MTRCFLSRKPVRQWCEVTRYNCIECFVHNVFLIFKTEISRAFAEHLLLLGGNRVSQLQFGRRCLLGAVAHCKVTCSWKTKS